MSIYSKQSGFRKRHITETALIGIIDELLFNLDSDRVSDMTLIDYCKASDMVDHSILLQKLQACGLDNKLLIWFRSYLNERRQLVSMGNIESPTTCVRHGVPQGSILGPLLFIAFINDFPLHVSSAQINLYADDTTLTATANFDSVGVLQSSLTTAISEVDQWATANKLPLNEGKIKVLTITGKRLSTRINHDLAVVVNEKQLENVRCAKLLGQEIDHELTFIPHVKKLSKNLSQRIGILKRIKHCLPLKHRLIFYNTLIRTVTDYVNVVWTTCDCLNRVLKLQKRAARIILDADCQASSVKLFNKLNWIPFFEQAKLTKCCIIYKLLQGHLPTYLKSLLKLTSNTHSRQTRYANFNIARPVIKRKTEGGRKFTVTACQAWNSLSLSMRKIASLDSFRNSLGKKNFEEQQLLNPFIL